MIQVFEQGWTAFLRFIETAPVGLWAMLAGIAISWGVTQRAKFWISEDVPAKRRHRLTQAIAFALGFLATLALWPTLPGVILAAAVGLWSPWSYGVFMRWIGSKWPEKRRKLSQDVRP